MSSNLNLPSSQLEFSENVPASVRALSQYLIIRKILEFLNIGDLFTCAQVNKSWNEVVTLLRKIRHNVPHALLYHPYPPTRTNDLVQFLNSFEISGQKNWIYSETHLPLIINLNTKKSVINKKTLLTDMEKSIKLQLRSKFSEPLFVFYFMCPEMLKQLAFIIHDDKFIDKNDERVKLFERLSCQTPSVFISNRGLIHSDPHSNNCFENEFVRKNPYIPMITGLTIPKLPGLTVETFCFILKFEAFESSPEEVSSKIHTFCSHIKNIKGFVLLSSIPVNDEAFNDYFNKNDIPVAGGKFETVFLSREDSYSYIKRYSHLVIGIILCGDENIKVASVGYDSISSKDIETKLSKLKSVENEGDSSFALMFQCYGRGKRLHKEYHIETQIFRKIFPNTVLAGAFVDGEIYKDVIPGQSPAPYQELMQYNSTSILFVSCKNR